MTTAYSLLTNWKQDARNIMQITRLGNDSVSFTNVNDNKELTLNTNGFKTAKDRPPIDKS
jgi:hypothetical protein